ncbi:MAG: hypothetical protein ACTSX4_02500 [Candidatus Helarchaeota archaeon]
MEFFTKERGLKPLTREEIIHKKYSAAIIPIIYGQMVPKILRKYGGDEQKTREILKEFGKKLGRQITQYWTPKKKKDIPTILKQTYRFFLKRKLKNLEVIEKEKKWIMVDDTCIMCWEGIDSSQNKVHYCTPMSGVIEAFVNEIRKKKEFSHIPKIKCETIESKARGDEFCKHEISVVE